MAAFLAVFFLFTLIFLLPLAKRLQATARAAQHIAMGNYQTQLSDHSKDELGEVGRSIDYLASNLELERKKRREVESELRHMASHDGLTGLLNRKTLTAVLTERADKVSHAPVTLLFIDLDRFKPINDTYGHTAGDLVLTTIAERLETVVGKQGMVARWGGDEFVVALRQLNEVSAQSWVQKIQQTIRTPVIFKGTELTVDASIGTKASDTSTNIEEMINRADQKMYRNKSRKHTNNRAA